MRALYRRDKTIRHYLEASLDAYQSAIQLAAYLERTMDTDEARIFLKRNSNIAYNKSIDLATELYSITHSETLLWKGYQIVERNKASVLVANLKEFGKSRSKNASARYAVATGAGSQIQDRTVANKNR